MVPVPGQREAASGSRRHILTCNNYKVGIDGIPTLWVAVQAEPRITAFVCGREVCPSTGTPHLQGYFETASAHRMAHLQAWPCFNGAGCRLAVADGTADHSIVYCTKEDKAALKYGEFSVSRKGQGKRSDWAMVHALAKRKAPIEDFAEEVPHLLYAHVNKYASWIAVHDREQRSWKTRPIIFYGPPRVGKSTEMRKRAAQLAELNKWEIYYKSDSDKWWPQYRGESIICIDEMHGGFFSWSDLLRFFEEGPFTVQFKGGSREFLGRVVFMTTNDHPAYWYRDARKVHRPWNETNAFRGRVEEFGELWTFAMPTKATATVAKIYHEADRDFSLEQPPLPPGQVEELDRNKDRF